MLRGIDVSEHQGNIDWGRVKSQIDFAIIKLGNIGDANKFWVDKKFERNYQECKRLAIPIGVYVYSYTNEVKNISECARAVINYLSGKKLELPIYIDMEDKEIAVEGKDKLTELVIDFNSIIEQNGRAAGVYANLNWFNNYLHKDIIKQKYTTWIAHYGVNENKYNGVYDMLQYTSSGRINGISGNVDMNVMYKNIINSDGTVTPIPVPSEGGYEVKSYKNGSTPETVYQDSNCTKIIGSLNAYEACDCLGEFTNGKNEKVAVVMYTINGSKPADRKVGFVKYIGGIGK